VGEVLLQTEGVVAGYTAEVDILNGVDMEVREGEIVTIVGPNGAGKSTLMKAIFGLLSPREGTVTLDGDDVTGQAPHSITRKGVAYVPQLDNVFPSLSVRENLDLGAIAGGGDVEERVDRMYELFPRLAERRNQAAGTMSGGERQMVAMARALMPDPVLLLVDEPSAGLAPAFVDAIFEKLVDINESGVTVLMVEQNAKRALSMSDRGYVLDLGKSRFTGPGKELIADPKVAELYLGGGGRLEAEAVDNGQG
jgi:ABC-type branched-subunit amino acid transport system ATPase component